VIDGGSTQERLWSLNLEQVAPGREGWALYTGSEGDAPWFLGFFVRRSDAEALLVARDADGGLLLCDPVIVPALLTEHGVVAANDFEIETHEQLRERLAGRRRL
jgi:hypothetical protein